MDSSTQQVGSVTTKGALGRAKREEIVKFRLSPEESYVLRETMRKAGFENVSTFLRKLIADYDKVREAEHLVGTFREYKRLEKELEAKSNVG